MEGLVVPGPLLPFVCCPVIWAWD